MAIKAKFKCISVTDFGTIKQAKMQAVYSVSGENADFSKSTPNGQIDIMVDQSTPAADFFKPQTEYYLTFEEANASPMITTSMVTEPVV